MFKQKFILLNKTNKPNGIGGFEEGYEKAAELKGYLDMLTGTETLAYNSDIKECSHILLTDVIKMNSKQSILDGKGNLYDIKFVDDPVGRGHHLEVYLDYAGDYNEI